MKAINSDWWRILINNYSQSWRQFQTLFSDAEVFQRKNKKSVTLKLYTEKHTAWSALALAAKIKTLIQARRENTAQIKRPQRPSFESATQGWMQQRSLQSQLWSEAAAADDLTGNICNSQISSTYISVSPSPFCMQLFTWCHHFTVWWTVMVFNNIHGYVLLTS